MTGEVFSPSIMIGGPAASGKTTIARLVARKHGLRWYSTDAHGWSHRARAVDRGLHDEDDPSPGNFDRGPLIQEDLDQLIAATPTAGTVVEGALITPDFAPMARSIWLMPSPEEQRRRLTQRSGNAAVHQGLLHGYQLINDQLAGTQAIIIDVDGQTVAQTLAAVETALAPAIRELPAGQTASDRQQLIRYGNRSLADQLRVSLDNGLLDPSSRDSERPFDCDSERLFDCECGESNCTRTVQLRPIDAIHLASQTPGAIRAERHDT